MSFLVTFQQHFDRSPPFVIPSGVQDAGGMVTTDPSDTTDELFELLGWQSFFKKPPGKFFCATVRDRSPIVTFYLLIIDGQRYLYFREQVRDMFSAASPESCYTALGRIYELFKSRTEPSFKLLYNQGALQVNNKAVGG